MASERNPAEARQAPAPRMASSLPPPHSMDAEQSVLGGLLLKNSAWFEISDIVGAIDFYTHDHRIIFANIAEMLNAGRSCDFVTLSEHLRQKDLLKDCGGISYLGTLSSDIPSAANIKAYAEIVRERAALRELIATGQDLMESAYHPDGRDISELVSAGEIRLLDMRAQGERGKQNTIMAAALYDRFEESLDRRGHQPPGLATHLPALNEKINGLQDDTLIVIAGRPGMGKTALALNIAEHVAIDQHKPSLVFSMEMPAAQLIDRIVSKRASIPLHNLIRGDLTDADHDALIRVREDIRNAPLAINDRGGLSPTEIRAETKRFKAKHGLSLVVIDYLQLMDIPSKSRGANRENVISEVSRSLKALAKELHCPVIVLSQLSRSLEARDNKRPTLPDLRESGAIEQDADMVLFVYREDYYDKRDECVHKGVAEIIVAKNRAGEPGVKAEARWEGRYQRFTPWTGPSFKERVGKAGEDPSYPKVSGTGNRRKAKTVAPMQAEIDTSQTPPPTEDDYS